MVADVYALQIALQIKTIHANEIVVVAPDEALVAYVYSAPLALALASLVVF